MERRDLIKKGAAAAAGLYLGNMINHAKFIAPFKIDSIGISSVPVINPVVEAEELVYRYQPANNGAGPLWCKGSSCIVRIGSKVFASGLETIPEWVPLSNCRWLLFERTSEGWKQQIADEGRTREPAPLVAFQDGSIFLSSNPSMAGINDYSGPARPEILLFKNGDVQKSPELLHPGWAGNPGFTEHSYRSFAADGAHGELILFQNVGDSHSEWAFRDDMRNWSAQGRLEWPWGADYEEPKPIRVCYPNVMIRDRRVYFFGVSDIIEPKKEWREYKKQITGREWDYDFRRLFITWSDDISSGKFHPWVEIASREETCGWIDPCDLWIGTGGNVHLLWNERAIDERLREKFFPQAKQSHALNYAIFRKGKVRLRRTLVLSEEGKSNEIPGSARFHVTSDNRLLVIYCLNRQNSQGQNITENRLMEITSKGPAGTSVLIPFNNPFTQFFTATVRGGSAPSNIIDMLGTITGQRNTISYARVRLLFK